MQGLLFVALLGFTAVSSLVVEHGLGSSVACEVFPDEGWNHVPCIGSQIPNHCTTQFS